MAHLFSSNQNYGHGENIYINQIKKKTITTNIICFINVWLKEMSGHHIQLWTKKSPLSDLFMQKKKKMAKIVEKIEKQ